MHETDIREDPNNYVTRNVFGRFDARSAVTYAVIAALLVPVLALTWRFSLPEPVMLLLMALVVAPPTVIGKVEVHGLHAERWIPAELAARREPAQYVWAPADVVVEGGAPAPRRRKRAGGAKAAAETEQQDGALERALAEIEGKKVAGDAAQERQ